MALDTDEQADLLSGAFKEFGQSTDDTRLRIKNAIDRIGDLRNDPAIRAALEDLEQYLPMFDRLRDALAGMSSACATHAELIRQGKSGVQGQASRRPF